MAGRCSDSDTVGTICRQHKAIERRYGARTCTAAGDENIASFIYQLHVGKVQMRCGSSRSVSTPRVHEHGNGVVLAPKNCHSSSSPATEIDPGVGTPYSNAPLSGV